MQRNLIAIIYVILWSFITTIAITLGIEHIWPDYVHVDYGYPITWGVHTLNTFHGPVDIWRVNVTALCIDLAVWLTALVIGLFIILYAKRPSKN
ncbi:MAG: hypothetical protein QXK26_02760 [Candidatus Bathyarchaeia archaeon]